MHLPSPVVNLQVLRQFHHRVSQLKYNRSPPACAYTAPVLLGLYETNYDDDTDTLIVKSREDGKELLVSRLTDVEDRVKAEKFFS